MNNPDWREFNRESSASSGIFLKILPAAKFFGEGSTYMIELGRGRVVAYVMPFSRVIFPSYH
jgi:hypothetical protein